MFNKMVFMMILLILAWYHLMAWTQQHPPNIFVSATEDISGPATSESIVHQNYGCHHRDYGNGATVCVCTKDYCDNLGQVTQNMVPPGSIAVFVTSKDGDRFKMETIISEQNNLKKAEVSIKIDRQKRYQKIIGFGGAFTDSAGINIDKLEPKLAERLIKDYYGKDGIEYNMGRIPIGGSDFSTRPYSYDDNAGDENPELSHFELQWEDLQFKIPYLKMAAQVSSHSVKYFGSPWSPPAWMKTNNKLNNGGFLIGKPGEKYYQAYAEYLIRFLQEYNQHNVSIWGLTIENEPRAGYDDNYRWNSLGFNSTMERDFLKLNLGPALDRAGFGQLNVMIFDDTLLGMDQFVPTLLSDPEASQYTSGVAFHWYDNPKFPNREQLDLIAEKYLQKYFLLSTEACQIWHGKPRHVWLGNWDTFDRYADDIIKDLNHWAGGWVDWNLALDTQGGPNWVHNFVDAPIIVNGTGTEYYKQPFFYALGHFSKFLSPESIRLGLTMQFGEGITNHSSIQATTFLRPDNGTVLTVLNTGHKAVPIQVFDSKTGVYSFQFTLKPNSLSSFIWYS